MSLVHRLTLAAVGVLVLSGALMGVGYYASVRAMLRRAHRARLDDRLDWLESAIDFDSRRGKLTIDADGRDQLPDVSWDVRTADGTPLWRSPRAPDGHDAALGRSVCLGPPDDPLAVGGVIAPDEWELRTAVGDDLLPRPARAAIASIDPDLMPTHVRSVHDGPDDVRAYRVKGVSGTREHEVEVTERGVVLRFLARDFVEYQLPPNHRVELALAARASDAGLRHELDRLAMALWTVGPAALLVAGAFLAAFVRWQLEPLGRMAAEAAQIGPESDSVHIQRAGTSPECVRLREAINAMVDRLGESLRRERRFAATAAHELRNPLACLRTAVEVALRGERRPHEYVEALRDVLSDVERLQGLVLGLLQLTRTVEGGAAEGRPVSVASLVRCAERRGYPLRYVSPGDDADITVEGDEELFCNALCNVLDNARRYAPGQPPVVAIRRGPGSVEVTVADAGPGIPEEDRDRIFEPLTRLDPAGHADDADGGFGLGLAVARSTVRGFGGDLVCRGRSDGEHGAEFAFVFNEAD